MISAYRLKSKLMRISTILDAERISLLDGDLPKVITLVQEREAVIQEIAGVEGVDGDSHRRLLQQIRVKAQRNAVLLKAAREGIAAGEAILEEINRKQAKLGTYDAKGNVGATTVAKPRHERRA